MHIAFNKHFIFLTIALWFALTHTATAVAQEGNEGESQAGVLAQQNPEVAEEARQTAEQDEMLEQRLAARLSRVEGLKNVNVEVAAGLVTLKGLVEDEVQKGFAGQLVETMDGVVAVNNRLQIDTALDRRLMPVLANGVDRLKRLVMAIPLLIVAGVVIWLACLLSRLLVLWRRPFNRFRNPFLADLLRNLVQLTIFASGVLVALNLLGATALVSAVLGAAGIAGLAMGFAFRDLVENYIAGVLLSLRQPFAPDDHVVIDGREGRVAALTSRATSLITLDGNHLRLPNALVFKGVILNYSRNPTRMFSFDVGVAQAGDLDQLQAAVVQVLAATPGVQATPAPNALVTGLNTAGATLTCSAWVDQRKSHFYTVHSEAMRRVRILLDNAEALPDLIQVQLDVETGSASPALRAPLADTPAATSADAHIGDQLKTERRGLARHNLLDRDAPRE